MWGKFSARDGVVGCEPWLCRRLRTVEVAEVVEQLWKSTEGAGFFRFQWIEGRIHKPHSDFPTDFSDNFVHVIDFVPSGKIQETDNLTQWWREKELGRGGQDDSRGRDYRSWSRKNIVMALTQQQWEQLVDFGIGAFLHFGFQNGPGGCIL